MPNDFLPSAPLKILQLRADLLRRTREFFDARGLFEVETPVLSHDIVIDRHLDPLQVTLPSDPRRPSVGQVLWLQTSPEFGMKRLMVAGAEAIYQISRAFRGAEMGRLHNPEFTIVEWYRRGDSYTAGMDLLSDLAETLLSRGAAERLSYAAAFQKHVGIDPHVTDVGDLKKIAEARDVSVPEGIPPHDRDAFLDLLLTDCVEPYLGKDRPTILHDYPASQAALAKVRPGNPPIAERFELYVDGIELANGYHELTDPSVLRERNKQQNDARVADGKPPLPLESRLLGAMDHGLPDCTGCALGFDRVVMLAAGATSLADVIAFPIDRA